MKEKPCTRASRSSNLKEAVTVIDRSAKNKRIWNMHGLIWKALGSNKNICKSAFEKYSFSQMMAILWSAPALLVIYITFVLCCLEAVQNDQEKKENGVCTKRNHIISGPNKQVIFESINLKNLSQIY